MGKRHARQPNAPLVFVCSVARFANRPDLGRHIDEILKALSDYPIRLDEDIFSFNPVQQAPPSVQKHHYLFSEDRKSSFLISQETLFFQTVDVERYEESWLRNQMKRALTVLSEKLPGLVFTFMGNRYVDVVRPRQGEALSDYLSASLLPLNIEGMPPRQLFGLQSYERRQHVLNIRYFAALGRSAIPDDLQQTAQKLDAGHLDLEIRKDEIVVDFDGAWTFSDPGVFTVDEMLTRFDEVHQSTSVAFDDAFTESAHKIWEGRNDGH